MQVSHRLETLSHPHGVVIVGWVAPRVLYARFLEDLPAPLGIRFAFHLRRLLHNETAIRYFADASELKSFDPRSSAVVRGLFTAHKHRFASAVVLPNSSIELAVRTLGTMMGKELLHVVNASQFRELLLSAAPRVDEAMNPRTWRSIPPVSMLPPEDGVD